jgi:hypothetical protein
MGDGELRLAPGFVLIARVVWNARRREGIQEEGGKEHESAK